MGFLQSLVVPEEAAQVKMLWEAPEHGRKDPKP